MAEQPIPQVPDVDAAALVGRDFADTEISKQLGHSGCCGPGLWVREVTRVITAILKLAGNTQKLEHHSGGEDG